MPQIPTAAQVQYMEAHIGDDKKASLNVASAICLVAAYVAVAMRFLSRRLIRAEYKADDWFIIAGLVAYTGYVVALSVSTIYGTGRHIILVRNAKALTIASIINECTYGPTILCTKVSILCLYNRIFPQRRFKIASLATAAFIFGWAATNVFVDIFQCMPISSQWDPKVSGRCVHFGTFVLFSGIINVITDFILLGLPMPLVWKIKTSRANRWKLSGIFTLGLSACVVSIVRLFYVQVVSSSADPTWTDVNAGYLTQLELSVGILAACIATYRPLFDGLFHSCTTRTMKHGSSSRPSAPTQPENIKMTVKANGILARIEDHDGEERLYTRMSEPMEEPVDERW
ncbi:MAG: hypothetical protein ASARMPREDX12_002446 [Alectoria sarmentosa]|nr:MAG: hypothetical protein ASARMPREDX12_002446 [Alectoria sarmentosa]